MHMQVIGIAYFPPTRHPIIGADGYSHKLRLEQHPIAKLHCNQQRARLTWGLTSPPFVQLYQCQPPGISSCELARRGYYLLSRRTWRLVCTFNTNTAILISILRQQSRKQETLAFGEGNRGRRAIRFRSFRGFDFGKCTIREQHYQGATYARGTPREGEPDSRWTHAYAHSVDVRNDL